MKELTLKPSRLICRLLLLSVLTAATSLFVTSCKATPNDEKTTQESPFTLLDEVVAQKKSELLNYLQMIEKTVSSIRDDGPLIESFERLDAAHNAASGFDANIENTILDVYLNRFMIFENIYFINSNGDVFYSLIKNFITLNNVFSGNLATTALAKKLKHTPESYIVDFDIFPNLDPAAFFVYPVHKNNSLLGWCIFELGADRLDTIFSSAAKLGKTGEVFLVNERNTMLTNSYFSPELSPLRRHLSPENISAKFNLGKGHLEITDYRGYKALTSFEVVPYHSIRWLISAKKDRDEFRTEQFLENPEGFYANARNNIQNRSIIPVEEKFFQTSKNRVKLDQFKRVHTSGDLYTHGVSTCTAILITLPGKFSYLAHVSAYDVLYGGKRTNIIENIFERIKKYEIPDYLLREVQAYVVTPRIKFEQNIVKEFVEQGLLLSQISIAKNPEAKRANVYYNLGSNAGFIKWDLQNGASVTESLSSLKNIGEYFNWQNSFLLIPKISKSLLEEKGRG